MKKFFIFGIVFSIGLSSYAGEPLSLNQFREMVVGYSNQIKMSKQNVVASESKFKATRTGYYPSLSVAADGNYFLGSPMKIDIPGFALKDYTYSASATIQQNVYTGNAVRSQAEADKISIEIAKMGQDLTLENVLYGAEVTYWALAASEQQKQITNHYVNIVGSLYSIVQDRFTNGYVSKTDLLMVETRLNEAKLQQIAAEKLYLQSLYNVNTMVGQYSPIEYVVSDTIGAPSSVPSLQNLDFALENRPDYMISQRKLDLSNQMVKVARSKFNPQFVVGVQGMFGTGSFNVTGIPNQYGVAFASFKAPVFMWGQRRHSVGAAKASALAQQYDVVNVKDGVANDLLNAQTSLLQSFKQAELASNNMKIAQENLDLNTYSYGEGKLPILDVLSAQLSWIQTFTAAVNSNYQYKVAFADYRKSIGMINQE